MIVRTRMIMAIEAAINRESEYLNNTSPYLAEGIPSENHYDTSTRMYTLMRIHSKLETPVWPRFGQGVYLSREDICGMKACLKMARDHWDLYSVSQTVRLFSAPFNHIDVLFGLEYARGRTIPCEAFGRQFVLKIVDELLDEGGD